MKPGLNLGGNTDIRVGSVTIKNGDVGIHSYGKGHVQIDRAEFDNVQQPYDIQGGSASIGGTLSAVTNMPRWRADYSISQRKQSKYSRQNR